MLQGTLNTQLLHIHCQLPEIVYPTEYNVLINFYFNDIFLATDKYRQKKLAVIWILTNEIEDQVKLWPHVQISWIIFKKYPCTKIPIEFWFAITLLETTN